MRVTFTDETVRKDGRQFHAVETVYPDPDSDAEYIPDGAVEVADEYPESRDGHHRIVICDPATGELTAVYTEVE